MWIAVELISKFVARTAHTGTSWVPALDHEVINNAMEGYAIVITFAREKDKIVYRVGCGIGEQVNLNAEPMSLRGSISLPQRGLALSLDGKLRFDIGSSELTKPVITQIDRGMFKGVEQHIDQPNAVSVVIDCQTVFRRQSARRFLDPACTCTVGI